VASSAPRRLWTAVLTLLTSALLVGAAAPKTGKTVNPPLKRESLVFEKSEGERHRALQAWMSKRAAGWHHVPLAVGGNFVRESWCAPTVKPEFCENGSVVTREERGTAWMTLETLHYPKDWPKVFGLVVSIGTFPAKGDLAIRFHLAEDGRSIVGEGMEATFLEIGPSGVSQAVSLGARTGLKALDTDLFVEAPGGDGQALQRLAASPESLRTSSLALLDALAARVNEAFAKGEVLGWDEGEYEGNGIPPTRTPRPLTPAEAQREKKAAHEEIARRKAMIERHFAGMHALLVAEVPVTLF